MPEINHIDVADSNIPTLGRRWCIADRQLSPRVIDLNQRPESAAALMIGEQETPKTPVFHTIRAVGLSREEFDRRLGLVADVLGVHTVMWRRRPTPRDLPDGKVYAEGVAALVGGG